MWEFHLYLSLDRMMPTKQVIDTVWRTRQGVMLAGELELWRGRGFALC